MADPMNFMLPSTWTSLSVRYITVIMITNKAMNEKKMLHCTTPKTRTKVHMFNSFSLGIAAMSVIGVGLIPVVL